MFDPPYSPYDPLDKNGFSYETVAKRWPIILTGVIDTLYRTNHDLHTSGAPDADDKIAEGKMIIEVVSKLKYQMGRDHQLAEIEDDSESMVDAYNNELRKLVEQGKGTWYTAPWLFAECYLYRWLRSLFARTKLWRSFDPFEAQKLATFKSSGASIYQIASIMNDIEVEKGLIASDHDKLGVLFKEMIQMCLWGNATDLSLLTHLTPDDIAHLQSVGKDAQQARKEFILRDDQDEVWDHLKSVKGGRVDFVLDNAGFELFTDLVFADFLVTYTPYISSVVFHPKLIPWFVSDVTAPDFAATLTALLDPSFFPAPPSAAAAKHVTALITRWSAYLASGAFKLSVPSDMPLGGGAKDAYKGREAEFWTAPWPFWDMEQRDVGLWQDLSGSALVVFKGDLNYRKLTGDIKWPVSTPFETAIGPLAGSFPLLSLRTNKADVVVGVPQEVADRLDERGEKWRTNGKYALVSFLSRR